MKLEYASPVTLHAVGSCPFCSSLFLTRNKNKKHIDASGMHVDTHSWTSLCQPLPPRRFHHKGCSRTKPTPHCYMSCVCPGQSVAIGYHSFKSEDRMFPRQGKTNKLKVHSSFAQHRSTLSQKVSVNSSINARDSGWVGLCVLFQGTTLKRRLDGARHRRLYVVVSLTLQTNARVNKAKAFNGRCLLPAASSITWARKGW